jgi:cytochrome c
MKKTFFIVACAVFAASCGNGSDTKATSTTDTASTAAATTTTAAAPTDDKALELIGSSDCTTCHRLHKSSPGAIIGPAYSDVAAKYPNAADSTVDRLTKKIIAGGSGVWGVVPMTPHPALKEADVKEMVKYILTLKS